MSQLRKSGLQAIRPWLWATVCAFMLLYLVETSATGSIMSDGDDSAAGNTTAPILIHLIPHSHCDVGWILTPPQYYDREVHLILDSVTAALEADTTGTLRFNWAETAWLPMWLADDSTGAKRALLKKLVADGKLENDEAVCAFDSVINQMTLGHDFIRSLGATPHVGWQLDPFGASAATPRLFAQMGFKRHVIDRVPLTRHLELMEERKLEFTWTPTPGVDASIFTHILDTPLVLYGPPLGFDWSVNNQSFFTSPPVTADNVKLYADLFVVQAKLRRSHFMTNNVMMLFGGDFHYQHAGYMFNNMSRVMAEVNGNPDYGVKIRYSTVSEYFDSLEGDGVQWPVVDDPNTDFLPYNMFPTQYWSGFYTSRPVLKGASRRFDARLHAAEELFVLARGLDKASAPAWFDKLYAGRKASGVMKHHDAMPGTARARVVKWYEDMLSNATTGVDALIGGALSAMVNHAAATPAAGTTGGGAAISAHQARPAGLGPLSTSSTLGGLTVGGPGVAVVLYNSLTTTRSRPACVPCPFDHVAVVAASGQRVASQTAPASPGEAASGAFTLCFDSVVPPMGYASYVVSRVAAPSSPPLGATPGPVGSHWPSTATRVPQAQLELELEMGASGGVVLNNTFTRLTLDARMQLVQVDNLQTRVSARVNHTLARYNGGGNAYQFLPRNAAPVPLPPIGNGIVHRGPVFDQVTVPYATWANHTLRLFHGCRAEDWWQCSMAEASVHVGPLPGDTDFTTRFSTDLDTQTRLFTDDSGLHTVERRPNASATDASGLTYPTLNYAYIRDDASDRQLSVLSMQPHAVASRSNGEIELIQHRRMLQFNLFLGLFQDLNDTSVLTDTVALTVDSTQGGVDQLHRQSLVLNRPLVATYSAVGAAAVTKPWSALARTVPPSVRLLSLQARGDTEAAASPSSPVLLRWLHMFAEGESTKNSQPVEVPMAGLFSNALNVTSVAATSLSALYTQSPQPAPATVTMTPLNITSWVVTP